MNQYYISTKKSFSGVRKILLLIQRKGALDEFLFTFHKIWFYNIYYEHKVALDRIFRVVKTAEISLLVFLPLLLYIFHTVHPIHPVTQNHNRLIIYIDICTPPLRPPKTFLPFRSSHLKSGISSLATRKFPARWVSCAKFTTGSVAPS